MSLSTISGVSLRKIFRVFSGPDKKSAPAQPQPTAFEQKCYNAFQRARNEGHTLLYVTTHQHWPGEYHFKSWRGNVRYTAETGQYDRMEINIVAILHAQRPFDLQWPFPPGTLHSPEDLRKAGGINLEIVNIARNTPVTNLPGRDNWLPCLDGGNTPFPPDFYSMFRSPPLPRAVVAGR